MAKWTDYTTDTNPTDTDEVMTLDADKSPKANKRVTLSTLADYFLDKLASKVFTKLETQNKTVIGALNELNSKAKPIEIINISKRVNISKVGESVYSGLEFTVPKGNIFIVQIKAYYEESKPSQIAVTDSKTECTNTTVIDKTERYPTAVTCVLPINDTDSTYYVWVKYSSAGMNQVNVRGISTK